MDVSLPIPLGTRLALDEAGLGEPAQLGIDLPVAGGPEQARLLVDDRLDLVAAHPPPAERSEDHIRGVREASYIVQIYQEDI